MFGSIPPLPNTPSRRDAQLKHRDDFTFTLRVILRVLYVDARQLHAFLPSGNTVTALLQLMFSILF
jgi:hypothetical protein